MLTCSSFMPWALPCRSRRPKTPTFGFSQTGRRFLFAFLQDSALLSGAGLLDSVLHSVEAFRVAPSPHSPQTASARKPFTLGIVRVGASSKLNSCRRPGRSLAQRLRPVRTRKALFRKLNCINACRRPRDSAKESQQDPLSLGAACPFIMNQRRLLVCCTFTMHKPCFLGCPHSTLTQQRREASQGAKGARLFQSLRQLQAELYRRKVQSLGGTKGPGGTRGSRFCRELDLRCASCCSTGSSFRVPVSRGLAHTRVFVCWLAVQEC